MISDEELEQRAKAGYETICSCAAGQTYLPRSTPRWEELPQLVKDAWKAAAAAMLKD